MAPYLPPTPETASIKYNHFHEYDDNNEEPFEIRELTPPPPSPSLTNGGADPNLSPTRVTKVKNAIKRVAGKQTLMPRGLQSPKRTYVRYVPEGGCAEFSKSWEAHVQDLKDEMFGTGKYYCPPDPSKAYEFEDPEPFRYRYISRTKTVRWGSSRTRITKIDEVAFEKDETVQEKPSDVKGTNDDQKEKPFCEVKFERPEPEVVYNNTKPETENATSSGFITIDLSNLPSANFHRNSNSNSDSSASNKAKSESNTNRGASPETPTVDIKKTSSCDIETCDSLCPQMITPAQVQKVLGPKVTDLIVRDLVSSAGKPLPLPPRDPSQNSSDILALRESTVIFTYALWAATFLFQRLIAAIRLSLDDFKPTHQGILYFVLQVSPLRYLINDRIIKCLGTWMSRRGFSF
jgi:hypothetical protein